MGGDCIVKMAAAGPSEPQEPHQSAVRTLSACHSGWKCGAALLAVTLCVAAVLCFTLNVKGTQEQSHTGEIKDLDRNLRQISQNARAAIHLGGKYNKSLSTSMQWKTNVDHYHSTGGLRLEDNQVVVPRTGLYFVYSQASFRLNCREEQLEQWTKMQRVGQVHLTYMVERWSDSYSSDPETYETILHSGRTACQPAQEPLLQEKWFGAVYVGAVFKLNAGDLLRTVVAKKFLPSVESDSSKTFFGVFAL